MIRIIGPNVVEKDFPKENYRTRMLFRCTSQLYAERFLEKGNIRFGLPQEWIDDYKINGDGRGDLLEGCYCCIPKLNLSEANFFYSLRQNVETFRDSRNNYLYFRSKDVLTMRTFCLFGLDENDFKKNMLGEDGKEHPTYTLSKKYFEDFSTASKEGYDELLPEEKPVVLMIHNLKEFIKRLRKFMEDFGINNDEWLIQPVGYGDKNMKFLVGDDMPAELFLKDNSFEYQKEIRVVIYTKRHSVLKKLNKCNGIVDLGYMGDIASIQEYYFGDMTMQIRNNNTLLYTLPRPIVTPLEKLAPKKLMAIIQQAYENRILGHNLDEEKSRNEYIEPLVNVLDKVYDIEFRYEDATFKKRGTNQRMKIELQ